jgi:hypothetical protein
MTKKLLVMTIAYNEEKNIKSLLREIKSSIKVFSNSLHAEILLVNDGSEDDTEKIAKECGVGVISHSVNLGPGVAVQTGYKYALRNNFDFIVRLDSDGQHSPKYIPKLLEPILKNEADLVIGSRYLEDKNYKTTFVRAVGIKFFSKLVSFIIKQPITDVTSGFRAMKIDIVKSIVNHFPSKIIAIEITIRKGLMGARIKEIPVEMRERRYGRSFLSLKRIIYYPLHSIYVALKTLVRYGG